MNDIQKYLIGGFIDYGHASDYVDIIPANIFGVYAPLFEYIAKHWTAKVPEYFDVVNTIGNKYVIAAMERSDVSFITERSKYVEQLFNIYVQENIKNKTPMELLEEVKETYIKLSYLKLEAKGGVSRMESSIDRLYEEVCESKEYGDKIAGYKTWIKSLDDVVSFQKGRTIMISAYSNTGKSAISYFIANNTVRQHAKVLYFSLEIPENDLRDRLFGNWVKEPMYKFDKKSQLADVDFEEYSKKEVYMACECFTMNQIEDMVAYIKPDVVIIDYVQLISGEGKGEYEQMNDVARRIRKMTAQNDVATLVLSQVSNDSIKYKKGGVIPSKGSGELVATANVVLVMQESEFPNRLDLHVAKNRHWKKGKCIELIPEFEISNFTDNGEIHTDSRGV